MIPSTAWEASPSSSDLEPWQDEDARGLEPEWRSWTTEVTVESFNCTSPGGRKAFQPCTMDGNLSKMRQLEVPYDITRVRALPCVSERLAQRTQPRIRAGCQHKDVGDRCEGGMSCLSFQRRL